MYYAVLWVTGGLQGQQGSRADWASEVFKPWGGCTRTQEFPEVQALPRRAEHTLHAAHSEHTARTDAPRLHASCGSCALLHLQLSYTFIIMILIPSYTANLTTALSSRAAYSGIQVGVSQGF
jgi:hypothetical protein